MNEPENNSETLDSPKEDSGIQVNVFGRTDVGLVRDHNEDNFLVADLSAGNRSIKPEVRDHVAGKKGSLFVVCDGMGGAAAGEVASKIGIDTIYELMQRGDAPKDNDAMAKKLETSIIEAGMRILTAAKLNRKQRGMGTTVTAAVLNGPRLLVGQVGDSRAYILRGEEFVQITKDQSLVQQLLDANQLTEEEARNFDKANIILQALGTTEDIHVDITSVELRRGDTLVMCSDGLTGPVSDNLIKKTMLATDDLAELCKQLTDLACDGGGQDNITVIAVRFGGEALLEPNTNDTLQYEKYSFECEGSDSAQTIPAPAKKAKVKKQKPEVKETKVEKVEPKIVKKAPEPEPETVHKGKSGLYAGVGIFLILCVAFGGYLLFSEEDDQEQGENGHQIIVEDPPSTLDPGHASTKQQHGDTDTWDKENEPVLAPTPEEAISGTGVDSESSAGSTSNIPETSTNQGGSNGANQGGNKPTPTGGGSKPPNSNEDSEDESEEDKPDDDAVIAPEPIDDNPF